ncbi:AEC family transporter, partial [Micromonospora sp. NPDC049580]
MAPRSTYTWATPGRPVRTVDTSAVLVALGASLHRTAPSRAEPTKLELAVITALKLVAQPVIAYAAGLALHLSAPQLLAVVVCAGLPTAQNTFIFGQEYGV